MALGALLPVSLVVRLDDDSGVARVARCRRVSRGAGARAVARPHIYEGRLVATTFLHVPPKTEEGKKRVVPGGTAWHARHRSAENQSEGIARLRGEAPAQEQF